MRALKILLARITPGQWKRYPKDKEFQIFGNDGFMFIATTGDLPVAPTFKDQAMANLELIEMAPNLLKRNIEDTDLVNQNLELMARLINRIGSLNMTKPLDKKLWADYRDLQVLNEKRLEL